MGGSVIAERSSDHCDRPLLVGLVQINSSFSNQHYFPYSVGLLQAYADRHASRPERYRFLPPVYSRVPAEDGVRALEGCDVVGFSTYVWNVRLSLEIARRLKARRPDALVVFGGPQVPDRAEAFLRQHPFVDIACHGEGERTFLRILEALDRGDRGEIPGTSYLERGRFVEQPREGRTADLAEIPSPYLEGSFQPLLDANPGHQWLALWETNRGCPFSCAFCDWGSSTASKVYRFDLERLRRELDWFAAHRIEFVFCCDANFGILPRDLELAAYAAETRRRTGYPHALSVQNTKNATERAYAVQKLLAESGLNKGVTISLQSVDPHTLESIKRQNISSDSFQELQRRFTRDGIETYSDLILALPGETYDKFVDGVAAVIAGGQHNRIQFNNLSVLPNAEMGDPEYQRKHGMVTVETRIINIHGAVDESDEIPEMQDLVIETASMPRGEWIRARAFAWMTALLHFDKVLQIPLVVLQQACGVGWRELLELFSELDSAEFPVLSRTRAFFLGKAADIAGGGPEFCASQRWLRIWWPADEYVLIELAMDGQLDAFYAEAQLALERLLAERGAEEPPGLLAEAIALNKSLLKVPFQTDSLKLDLSWNVWDVYRSTLRGAPIPLAREASTCVIDRSTARWKSWDEWCREVVWYGNKKGAYLYGSDALERQIDGHY